MGIQCKADICTKSQDAFHVMDKVITGLSFEIHNEIGRFCDEKIYQKILAAKCLNASISATREVEINLKYKDFTKIYKLDLLVDSGIIYELKTVKSLNDYHKQQLINYLLLTGISHGKLLNFRSSSVEYEFISTTLTHKDRYDYSIQSNNWQEVTSSCNLLKSTLSNLFCEWGLFLKCGLYNEALLHFLGGSEKIINPVEIYFKNKVIGAQKMQLLNNETAFHISAITRAFKDYEKNIRRLIEHTKINTVQWINLNQRDIKFKTIKK
jgi:GxxExxY protein